MWLKQKSRNPDCLRANSAALAASLQLLLKWFKGWDVLVHAGVGGGWWWGVRGHSSLFGGVGVVMRLG